MQYGGIIFDDFANGQGVCTSVFLQGCPIRCPGCHNPHLQDFNGGKEFTDKEMTAIINSLTANGVQRNLCILGGEPLCEENIPLTDAILFRVGIEVPNAKIFVWTGYTYEDLINKNNFRMHSILEMTDYLIDGPYIESKRDVTLPMRGSSNQRIIDVKQTIEQNEIVLWNN